MQSARIKGKTFEAAINNNLLNERVGRWIMIMQLFTYWVRITSTISKTWQKMNKDWAKAIS